MAYQPRACDCLNVRRTAACSLFLLLAFFMASEGRSASAVNADWPTYGYGYDNLRHVTLTQINAHNVASLTRVWQREIPATGPMESSPIVVNGVMYVTTAERDGVLAVDAATGSIKWQYWPTLGYFVYCCAKVNRGVAVMGGRVFVATLDGRLIALDAASGAQIWSVAIGDAHDGFGETAAPLAWHGIVYIGSAGGDFGIRGSYSAYRASDGALLWRWWATNPGWEGRFAESVHGYSLHRDTPRERAEAVRFRDAWRHGGGAVWMTPALDTARATIYLSTGNPAPVFNGATRPGDNLYTNSIVALDARTGHMQWYYQETPHDVWDYDAASPPFLFDAFGTHGARIPAVGEAGKTGWLYVLDRASGSLLRVSENLVSQRQMYAPRGDAVMQPAPEGGAIGPASYDPSSRLAFVVAIDRPDQHVPAPVPSRDPSRQWLAGSTQPLRSYSRNYICAVSPDTGRVVWRRHLSGGPGERFNFGFISGSLSGGDIVFVPEPNGVFYALDARTGATLWRYDVAAAAAAQNALSRPPAQSVNARLDGPPVHYVVDGKEYIAVGADIVINGVERNVVMAFALTR